jgi:hypothetical protein
MGVCQSFFSIAFATLGLALSPLAANAIGFSTVESEAQLKALLNQPAFVAQGQFGNLGLYNNQQTAIQINFARLSGEQQPFSLSYDGSTVKYAVGNTTLETQIGGIFPDLFIYTKAAENNTSLILDRLLLIDSLTTLSISGIAASSPNNEQSIFHISGITGSFTLTGNATLSWINPPQNPDNLAYQIQVGDVDSPTPAPDSETNEGGGWFDWLPIPEAERACSNS